VNEEITEITEITESRSYPD